MMQESPMHRSDMRLESFTFVIPVAEEDGQWSGMECGRLTLHLNRNSASVGGPAELLGSRLYQAERRNAEAWLEKP
jgi:hypothetical protein